MKNPPIEVDHPAQLRAALADVTRLENELAAHRRILGQRILEARDDGGMTVPAVADVLGWSEANVFRVSAQAKKAAAGNSPSA